MKKLLKVLIPLTAIWLVFNIATVYIAATNYGTMRSDCGFDQRYDKILPGYKFACWILSHEPKSKLKSHEADIKDRLTPVTTYPRRNKAKFIRGTRNMPIILTKGRWRITVTNLLNKRKWVQIQKFENTVLVHPSFYVNPRLLGDSFIIKAEKLIK